MFSYEVAVLKWTKAVTIENVKLAKDMSKLI